MIFNAKQKVIYITISIIFIISCMAYNFYKEAEITKNYLTQTFTEVAHEIDYVVDEIKQNQANIEAILKDPTSISGNDNTFINITLHTYPKRGVDEYGFNQGVYPNTLAVGTLYGQGTIPDDLDKKEFLALDQLWSNYRTSLLTVLPYAVNYKKRYVYISTLMQYGSEYNPIFPGPPSPKLYRQGLGDSYIQQTEQYGFFVSQPFESFITNSQRLFFVVPVYQNGEIIADFGSTIQVDEINHLLNLYPKLAKGVEVNLIYPNGFEFNLNDTLHDTIVVYSVNHPLAGGLIISAQYDLLYFIKEKIQLFIILCLLTFSGFIFLGAMHKCTQHQKRLGKQLYIDHMTGLYNRRIIENELTEKINSEITDKEISFIAIDADKFKQINDVHGHNMGDKAIIHLAKTLMSSTRQDDYCIRMGGDEFLIILFNMPFDLATLLAERLEKNVSENALNELGIECNISCACIVLNKDEDFDQAYKRADDALYQKKRGSSHVLT